MPEHYGKTQNLSFYDQVLLSAGERAKALTLQMTGGQPNPAIETKITLGLLAQIVAPVVSEGLSAQAREMGAESRIALRDKATAGRAEQHALRTNLRKKAREDVLRAAKRLGALKVAEVAITEGPKLYEGYQKAKTEREIEEAMNIPQEGRRGAGLAQPDTSYKAGMTRYDEATKHLQGIGDVIGGITRSPDISPGPLSRPTVEGLEVKEPDPDLFDLSGTRYAEDADYWTDIIMNPTLETERVLQERLK